MSEEQLKEFIAKAQADTSLQEQLKAEGADPVAIAKAAGFAITTEDLNAHKVELSDDELEGVAGAGGWFYEFGRFMTVQDRSKERTSRSLCSR